MSVRRVLVIGPSNIGDAILVSPVIARLSSAYPQAELTLLLGERAQAVFAHDPRVAQRWRMEEFRGAGRLRLIRAMWRLKPDRVIDLRQTVLPLFWKPWRLGRALWPVPSSLAHMRQRHLWRLAKQDPGLAAADPAANRQALWISSDDHATVERLLTRWGVNHAKPMVIICPGARSHIKRWSAAGFAAVADRLIAERQVEVMFSGETDEMPIIEDVRRAMRQPAHNAAGSTTLQQLGALMQRAALVLTNDSASLHLACAVGAPTVALFGPTDSNKYGPTGPRDRVVRRQLFCAPCEQAQCRFSHECMRFIAADEVYAAAANMLAGAGAPRLTPEGLGEFASEHPSPAGAGRSLRRISRKFEHEPKARPATAGEPVAPQRILVIRLDRIGDVVLSTPVLQALRQAYPDAFLAMMVRPECRELVEGNPAVNQVLLYDKDGAQRGVWATARFARSLRAARFETALMLHPSHRSHWIPWLAGIPSRIGYDRKSGWLLTCRLPHRKQEGARHEADYTLDLVRALGIDPPSPKPFVPVHPDLDRRVGQLLQEQGIAPGESLIAIHPSASGLSKRWKAERFAQVADRLIGSHQARILLVAGAEQAAHAHAVAAAMRGRAVDCSGRLSVGELACLFRRCRLLISNDSGPVHIAAAVGTPVVDLFGRSRPGLNPERWRALGEGHVILSKPVPPRPDRRGGQAAPAHGEYESPELDALTADEVYQAAVSILSR